MRNDKKIDSISSNELYAQYMYRAVKLNVSTMGIFSTSIFLRSSSYQSFKTFLFNKFLFKDNFAYDSGKKYPLVFSLFINKKLTDTGEHDKNIHFVNPESSSKLLDKEFFTGEGPKLRNLIKSKMTDFVTSNITLSMPLTIKPNNANSSSKISKSSYLGSLATHPLVSSYSINRGIYSAPFSNHQIMICKDNIFGAVTYFTIRSLTKPTLYNEGDDFLVPKDFEIVLDKISKNEPTSNTKLESFIYDSLIFSIFDSHSYQSALKKDNKRVRNEWLVLDINESKELFNNSSVIIDSQKSSEISKLIKNNYSRFSSEAKKVLENGKKLYYDTLKLRERWIIKYPDLNLDLYDAGIWQIREALKRDKTTLKSLIQLENSIDVLMDKLTPLVLELGFLK